MSLVSFAKRHKDLIAKALKALLKAASDQGQAPPKC
jgi:hypothetical protein